MATGTLAGLGAAADHSWLSQLVEDPESERNAPNKKSRRVTSGHFVPVRPTPLPKPKLVIHSEAMAKSLGISEETISSEDFAAFFSGDQTRIPGLRSWCTPYALAIMGEPMYRNCPFGDGTGYGDGRAVSVGEVVVDGQRWEMQLKGGGTTPFCRGADGRAVLRSSVREFLASEAMFHLGIDTTRALSLIVSGSETTQRPWYSARNNSEDPDQMITESCAITTRVAPSFVRVGHLDLFARRANARTATDAQREEHRQIVEHALFREYPELTEGDLPARALAMLDKAADKFAALVAGWLRVGFCQGNFNADNCLISGRTMDYGPFGFMDMYDPLFAKWVGSGHHFAFLNQPSAALANYATLVSAVLPVLGPEGMPGAKAAVEKAKRVIVGASEDAFRAKMGFAAAGCEAAAGLWKEWEPLMRRSRVDYTIFWRQLAEVAELPEAAAADESQLLQPMRKAFYGSDAELLGKWAELLQRWRAAVAAEDGGGGLAEVAKRLRATNPKYIPREWMLVEAYDQACTGNYALVHEMHELFKKPYDEQPEFEERYYRLAPAEALRKGGIAKMT